MYKASRRQTVAKLARIMGVNFGINAKLTTAAKIMINNDGR